MLVELLTGSHTSSEVRRLAQHNAVLMSRGALRVVMRHQSEQTTVKYIN